MAINSLRAPCIALAGLLFVSIGSAHAQAPGKNTTATPPPAAVLAKASTKRGPIVAEQRKTLRRVAKLNQLLVIARQEGNEQLATRVEDLLKKEKSRHIRRLMQLKIGKKILMAPPRLKEPVKE